MPLALRRLLSSPVLALVAAFAAALVAQATSEAGIQAGGQPVNLAFAVLALVALVLEVRGSPAANLLVWLGAAIGVRALYTAQPTLPLPGIPWARGTGLEPPQHLLPVLFSGSVLGIGQVSTLLLGTAALSGAALASRRLRVACAGLAVVGAIGTVMTMAAPLPMISNDLVVPGPEGSTAAADGDRVPCWIDDQVVERLWSRRTHAPMPGFRQLPELAQNEMALSAIAEGMAMSTHGESRVRQAMWGSARFLTALQFPLRLLAMLTAVLALPIALGTAFRPAERARHLSAPGWILLFLLAGGNLVYGLLDLLLPEGGATALQALPFHLALAGFVAAVFLAARRILALPGAAG